MRDFDNPTRKRIIDVYSASPGVGAFVVVKTEAGTSGATILPLRLPIKMNPSIVSFKNHIQCFSDFDLNGTVARLRWRFHNEAEECEGCARIAAVKLMSLHHSSFL